MLQDFGYLAPKSLTELYAVLKKNSGKAIILAGGTDVIVNMHNGCVAPATLVDIKKIAELGGIKYNSKTGLSIGATVTCVEVAENKDVIKHYPLLAKAVGEIGSPQLRNRATVAGNICTASPCADSSCALMALGASVELSSADGVRTVALKDFFLGPKKTQIKPHEVLTRITVPADMTGAAYGMNKLKRIKGHDIALVSVAIAKTDKIMRVAIGSAAPTPVVTKDLAANATLKETLSAVSAVAKPIDDVRASKDYREFMISNYVEQIYTELFNGKGCKK
ncbi:MAG: xanthine dehydrogenase family protein subunit M [Candidatus Riflebacteria bacterium]|nr:xanthine dehydrogenase family protein subunit M [Candidatus Riflebacteria bacterium]